MTSKILIVDDKAANLYALKNLLQTLDVEVHEAASGNAALRATLNARFALVMLDVQMPGMNGYEVAELMRANEATEQIPIIFLSAAYSDDFHVFRGYEAGGVDFIAKPYNPDILLSKVQVFLELDAHRQSLEEIIAARTRELVTSNQRLTASLQQTREAEARNHLLATVVEQSSDAIMITDPQGVIQYVNSTFEQVTQYPASEAVGQTPSILKSHRVPESTYEQIGHHLRQGLLWHGQLTNRRRDDSLFEADVRISPVHDDTGQVTHYVATERDVTRELELNRQLNQAQKMEAIGVLAGGVAHDFNNLLTIILGQTQLMQFRLNGDHAKFASNLDSIQEAANRATMLTRQLLAFSRKTDSSTRVFCVNQAISQLVKMVNRLIGEDIDLTTALCSDKLCIHADQSQIEQAILNLTVNARDAMPTGGCLSIQTEKVEAEVVAGATEQAPSASHYACIVISDTGCGMDEETCSRIFEPFFTTKEVGKGTGLGLAMVYSIVDQYNGCIKVNSEIGKGSTFLLYFPLSDKAETPQDHHTSPLLKGRGETILVTEDEDGLRTLTQEVLASQNFNVLLAANADEAMAIAADPDQAIDLLVTDIVMPGRPGTELAKEIRDLRPDVRVLFMTGYTDRQGELSEDQARHMLLLKPFTPHGLVSKIQAMLKL